MVVPAVAGQELLIGQVGDGLGVTAGIVAIDAVGEQHILDGLLDDAVHTGHGTLHFVKDYAVVLQTVAVFLVMPAFLVEDVGIGEDLGGKDRVQVNFR